MSFSCVKFGGIVFFILAVGAGSLASKTAPTPSPSCEGTRTALEHLKSALAILGHPRIDTSLEFQKKDSAPPLFFGRTYVNGNTDVVDQVQKDCHSTATIFVKKGDDFVRIATNVLKSTGERATGTMLARKEAYAAVIKGGKFCGEVDILGRRYDACYEAIITRSAT